ncbi:ras-like protein [Anaeramoeba ignava]|uniref:Ras-like protein n=1 Tax=Anaeramoeba ignava TaxID=1746090 RepID=A0A9Q0LEC5_ANAIG|nr:ras-like protein [Anaeramoeba ignava]
MQNVFDENYNPTIDDLHRKQIMKGEQQALLEIRDTAGQEEFRNTLDRHLRETKGIIIVFSIDSKKSLQRAKKLWNLSSETKETKKFPVIFVGNKSDLEELRAVTEEDEKQLNEEFGVPVIESSAKTGKNIKRLFDQIINLIDQIDEEKKEEKKEEKTEEKEEKEKKKKCLIF